MQLLFAYVIITSYLKKYFVSVKSIFFQVTKYGLQRIKYPFCFNNSETYFSDSLNLKNINLIRTCFGKIVIFAHSRPQSLHSFAVHVKKKARGSGDENELHSSAFDYIALLYSDVTTAWQRQIQPGERTSDRGQT